MTSSAASWTLAHRRGGGGGGGEFISDDMARALQKLGAEVVGPVPTRDKALALVEAGRVDAAVLDINLRGQTVFPVADALRERGVPFVFATGYDPSTVPAEYQDV